jgi:outer membrane protein
MARQTIIGLFLATMFLFGLAAGQSAQAQDTRIAVGLGAGLAPDYEGSEDYAAVLIPYLNAKWSNHMSVNWLGGKVKANLIPSPIWRGGVVAEYIPERDNVDNNRVDRLKDVDTAIMLGGFLGFQFENWSADIEAMTDVADGNDGSIVRLNGGYRIPVDQTLTLSLGVFTTWADDDYMEAYFTINNANADRSGLRTYDADAGFKDVGLNLSASYSPWGNWGLMGLASYKRMLNDAEDSPVVDDEGEKNQFMGGVLVTYSF